MADDTTHPIDDPAADRRIARRLLVLVMLIMWGLITHGTFAGSGDEPHYMIIAHSIAFDGDVDVANDYAEAWLIGGGTLQPERHAILSGGRLRPVHDIGMALVLSPLVAVAYVTAERLGDVLPAGALRATRLNKPLLLRHQISLLMAFLAALVARELFFVLRRMGANRHHALGWALMFACTPPVMSHAFLFFTEVPTALVTLFVFRRLSSQPLPGPLAAAALGALTGYLWLVHARNIGIVAAFVLIVVLLGARRVVPTRFVMCFVSAVMLGAFARCAVAYALWGNWLTTPHAAVHVNGNVRDTIFEVLIRATGLLFDREHGLLAYAPIYLLAAPGMLLMWRRQPSLARDALIVIACYLTPVLLPQTNVHGWRGGWSPAARFLVPIAPLLWLAVQTTAAATSRAGCAVVTALTIAQIVIDGYLWQFPKALWNDGDGASAFPWNAWLPSWIDTGAERSFAVAVVVACVLSYLMLRYADDRTQTR